MAPSRTANQLICGQPDLARHVRSASLTPSMFSCVTDLGGARLTGAGVMSDAGSIGSYRISLGRAPGG